MTKLTLKIIYLFIAILLISCGNKMAGKWNCTGGMVSGLEFLSDDQVILGIMGAKTTTTYVKNKDMINIKTD
ncbi:MAG TPA: hypothetical protein PK079_11940 [Leptospiraceae bacterium]|nr:hypothetical protein [Leptospiraceae bacterium]HMW07113.1 hypothetical protein [Leptospiraceae bacterium]HMX31787.1 hypothetical protein [Leptospiraceae bacterium]HMY32570.1 hypothetical protein [Leptospiraceae bacterium]HMZ63896.1 hypothetical protein [Leptospiraceae bacterium]